MKEPTKYQDRDNKDNKIYERSCIYTGPCIYLNIRTNNCKHCQYSVVLSKGSFEIANNLSNKTV